MKYLKNFGKFLNEGAEPATKPKPKEPSPTTKPKPGTNPKPSRPSPFKKPGERPGAKPGPLAKGKRKKDSAESVAERFITELNNRRESVKKYIKR